MIILYIFKRFKKKKEKKSVSFSLTRKKQENKETKKLL